MGGMDMGASPSAKSAKATLSPDGSAAGAGAGNVAVVKNQVHVDARVQQLTAASKYTVHLHRGACAASGDVIKTVGDIQTDASGAGTAHLEYDGTDLPAPAFLDVHPAAATTTKALCGDLL